VDWAIAYRVNAGEDDIVIMPSTLAQGLILRRASDRNIALFERASGTGFDRCHDQFDYDRSRFWRGPLSPTVAFSRRRECRALRWAELGLDKKRN
jgi:hypothetical protein